MSGFAIYSLLAVATAFTSLYEHMMPVMFERQLDKPPLEHPWLWYIVFFALSLLAAPIVFLSCIIPSWAEAFRKSLAQAMFEPQSKF